MSEQIARDIGKALITIGLAVGGTVIANMSQLGVVTDKLDEHKNMAHPPHDYRALQDEKIRNIQDDIRKLENRGK